MLLTVYGYPAPPVKRSPQLTTVDVDINHEPDVPYPIGESTSGVSITVDTEQDYDDGHMSPYGLYKRFVYTRTVISVHSILKHDFFKRQIPIESMTSPPSRGSMEPPGSRMSGPPGSSQGPLNPLSSMMSGPPGSSQGSLNPLGSMMPGLPGSSQGTFNPLTSASRGLSGVGQLANPLTSATSRLPVDQIPGMQMLPMQQLNPSTWLGD